MARGRRGFKGGDRGRGDHTSSFGGSNGNHNNEQTNPTPTQQIWKRGQGKFRGGSQRGEESNTHDQSHGGGNKKNVFDPASPAAVNTTTTPGTPFPMETLNAYRARLVTMRDDRPRQKARFIEQGLMNPDGPMSASEAIKRVGTCTDMCPQYERVRRIAEDDVKAPECTPETQRLPRKQRHPDETRMVKAFARSSAGDDVEFPSDLRSPAALQKTMDYMFKRLDNDDFEFLYTWIWDRTRSVRKDFTTQDVEKPHDIAIFLNCHEQCARFLLLSLHYMAKSNNLDYSHQQDIEQYTSTWTSLRQRYKDNLRAGIPSANEAEFWAYRIILGSHYETALLEHEMHGLPSHIRLNGRVKTATDVFHALNSVLFGRPKKFVQAHANWKKFWDLVRSSKVSYVMACAAEISFNRVRHLVLDTIWTVYRRGTANKPVVIEDWTIPKLKEVLGFDTGKEVFNYCKAFGFSFGKTADGQSFLDITSITYPDRHLRPPTGIKEQTHSERIVEKKRYNRALSAVIQGMSVRTARNSGLMLDEQKLNVTMLQKEELEAEERVGDDSLFVPDNTAHKPEETMASPFAQAEAPKAPGPASDTVPRLNPFAQAFQPGNTPGSSSSQANPLGSSILGHKATPTEAPKTAFTSDNPFQAAAAKVSHGAPGSGLANNVQPGLFDASKNPIQFATPASTTNSPFNSAKSENPFAPVGPSKPAPNPFSNAMNTNTTAQPSPFAPIAATKTPESTASPPSSLSAPLFSFANFTASESKVKETPAVTKTPVDPAAQEAEQRKKAEEERLRTLEEQKRAAEQQQLAAEEQRRRAQAEQQRLAREAEQRRLQEELLKRRAQEQARKAKEENERRAREEEQRLRDQIEAARKAREQQRESAMVALTEEIYGNPEEGLLTQYVENLVGNLTKEAALELQEERANKLAEDRYQQRRLLFARVVCARWISQVEKKKRARKARNRRKWLRENAERLANLDMEAAGNAPSPSEPATLERTNKTPAAFKKPAVPASSSRNETQSTAQEQCNVVSKAIERTTFKPKKISAQALRVSRSTASMSSDTTSNTGYSSTYQRSNAPIDRTETDWFKLKAMGIDPSKHRKRSFDSVSDDEEKREAEPKRARTSPSPSSRRSLPPPTTDEERIARFRAVRDALNSSQSTPMPVNGARSINGNSSQLIMQARELIATTPKHSPPNVQHSYSRSVPNFGMSTSSGSQSTFGNSIAAPQSNTRPAYWGRTSRFVPAHLYGKGPEAILAYRNQYIKGSPPISKPLQLSSPVSTQHPYVPQDDTQNYSEESVSEDEVSHVAGGAHGYVHEEAIMTDEDEYDEDEYDEDEDDMEEPIHEQQHGQGYYKENESNIEEEDEKDRDVFSEEDEEVYSEDEEMEETDDEEPEQQFSQSRQQLNQAGFTQDDAIELSD